MILKKGCANLESLSNISLISWKPVHMLTKRDWGICKVIFIIILSFLITALIHELGHCWGIYRYGYRPTALTIGLGKPLFTIRYRGVPCSICPLPIGASVQVPPAFDNELWWKKFVVDIGGPLVNIFLGFGGLIFSVIALCISRDYSITQTSQFLGKFMSELLNIGHHVVSTFEPKELLGIGMEKHADGWAQIANSEFSWLAALILFFTINLAIGLFNLIPFPSLDGYHILKDIFQGITGKRLPRFINTFGFIIVVILSVVTTLTIFGYPVIYAWSAVLAGVLLGMIKFYKQKRRQI